MAPNLELLFPNYFNGSYGISVQFFFIDPFFLTGCPGFLSTDWLRTRRPFRKMQQQFFCGHTWKFGSIGGGMWMRPPDELSGSTMSAGIGAAVVDLRLEKNRDRIRTGTSINKQ